MVWWSRRTAVFILGWLAYATTYLLRRPLSVIKGALEVTLKLTKTQLGWLDIALNLPYALGQLFLSSLGDVYPTGRLYALCLFSCAASCVTFGWWHSYYAFFVLLFLTGLSQSLCWPCTCKVVGSWFPSESKEKNTAFGVLGVSACAGSVLGTSLAVLVQDRYGWRHVYFAPSIITAIVAIPVLMFFHSPDHSVSPSREHPDDDMEKKVPPVIGIKALWKIRLVPDICVALLCVKTVRYIIQMWIAMYSLQKLGYSYMAAGMLSTSFDVGGMAGSTFIGTAINRCYRGDTLRGIGYTLVICGTSLVLCHLTSDLGKYFTQHSGVAGTISCCLTVLFLFVAGACNFGSDSILGGAVPYDIGERGGRGAGAAIAGFVNGFGTLGGVLEGPLVGVVSDWYGWTAVFYLMVAVSFLGACITFRAWSIDEKDKNGSFTSGTSLPKT